MEPDCLVPAALHQHFGAEIYVVLAEEGDRAYACMPIRAVRASRFPHPYITTTQVRRTIDCGTPLIDAERGAEGVAAILTALTREGWITRSRVLTIPKVSEDGPVFEILKTASRRAGLPFAVIQSWDRALLRRRPQGDYEQLFDARFRSELRRRRRRLAEELGTEPVLVDRTTDPAAVERFLQLEASGYKAENRIAMKTERGEPELFGDMCTRFAAAGRLHLLALEAGGQTLAMEVWLRGGDGLFMLKISYDERYARYGPGIQMQVAAMERFHMATDASWLDTCTYVNNETLLRLYPDRRQTANICIVLSRNPLYWALVRSFLALRTIHKRLSQLRSYALPGDDRSMTERCRAALRWRRYRER